ncbi:MAG: Ig-like domain-containing protein, partial [Cytophagales bacterium]|nr:Ig-like domain-containing protein [Cytophagales bacterium]
MLQRIFLLMLASQLVLGQVRDNFSSTTLTGIWTGNRSLFTTTNGYLSSNGTSTTGSNIYLSTSVAGLNNMEWQFFANLKFAPSSTNYLRFYLNSSSPVLNSTTNGYYIQIGETNQDTIKLFKQIGSSRTRLLASSNVCYSSTTANYSNVRIKVQRDDTGVWSLYSDCSGGQNFTLDGSIFDNTFTIPGFAGPHCIYGTPSRFNLFQLDDISILPIGFDDTPPELVTATVLNSNTLSLEFSESLEKVSAENINNYVWSEGQMAPNLATLSISGSTVLLVFPQSFPSYLPQQIQISGIQDLQGNALLTSSYSFTYQPAIHLVQENFSDGDFTNNPIWTGTSHSWEIRNQLLHSISTTPNASFYLSTPFTRTNATEWELFTQLEFNPSSVNYVDFVLQSDDENLLTNFNNGYFIRQGGTTDEISLYKKSNGVNQLIINGKDNSLNTSNNSVKVKIIRDEAFRWTLYSDISGTGDNYYPEGSIQDSSFQSGKYIGFIVRQSTASFFGKHNLGSIYAGSIRKDTIRPRLEAIIPINENSLEINFSEKIDTNQAKQLGSIVLNGTYNPKEINIISSTSLLIKFLNPFTSGVSNILNMNGVKDISGNQTDLNGTFIFTKPFQVTFREITINEIYADESPSNGLPDCEYLELYNHLQKP